MWKRRAIIKRNALHLINASQCVCLVCECWLCWSYNRKFWIRLKQLDRMICIGMPFQGKSNTFECSKVAGFIRRSFNLTIYSVVVHIELDKGEGSIYSAWATDEEKCWWISLNGFAHLARSKTTTATVLWLFSTHLRTSPPISRRRIVLREANFLGNYRQICKQWKTEIRISRKLRGFIQFGQLRWEWIEILCTTSTLANMASMGKPSQLLHFPSLT